MTARELASTYRSNIITRRWLATIVDFVAFVFLGGAIGAVLDERSTMSIPLVFAVVVGYYVGLEATTGRTIGKLFCGIKVVNERGEVPSVKAVLIRTATRLLEVNPVLLGGIPAGIIADRSSARQRWGDMLAGTYVVFTKDASVLTAQAAA